MNVQSMAVALNFMDNHVGGGGGQLYGCELALTPQNKSKPEMSRGGQLSMVFYETFHFHLRQILGCECNSLELTGERPCSEDSTSREHTHVIISCHNFDNLL